MAAEPPEPMQPELMVKKRVSQRDLPALLERLKAEGVTEVRRRRARFDGSVDVTWREPGESDPSEDLRLWAPAFVLSGIFSVLLIIAWLVHELTRTH